MKANNEYIYEKMNRVIPFNKKGITWAAFLNIIITSKDAEEAMDKTDNYEPDEILDLIEELANFSEIRIDLLNELFWKE